LRRRPGRRLALGDPDCRTTGSTGSACSAKSPGVAGAVSRFGRADFHRRAERRSGRRIAGHGIGSGGPDEPEFTTPRDRLLWAMERTGWVQAKAGRLLGLTTRQVTYALRKYNIEIKRF